MWEKMWELGVFSPRVITLINNRACVLKICHIWGMVGIYRSCGSHVGAMCTLWHVVSVNALGERPGGVRTVMRADKDDRGINFDKGRKTRTIAGVKFIKALLSRLPVHVQRSGPGSVYVRGWNSKQPRNLHCKLSGICRNPGHLFVVVFFIANQSVQHKASEAVKPRGAGAFRGGAGGRCSFHYSQ